MAMPGSFQVDCAVEWTVEKPKFGDHKDSPIFKLQNHECYLTLFYKYDRGTDYRLYVYTDGSPSLFFNTIVYLINGKEYIVFPKVEYGDTIWACAKSEIIKKVPEFEDQSTISFRVILRSKTSSDQGGLNARTGEKSVQTPSYLDARFPLQSLSRDLGKLMVTDSDFDMEFTCGSRTFKAHRNILGARSDVLKTMLQSDMKEGKTGMVEIEDMEPTVFEHFLRHLYTGNLPDLTVEIAKELYEAADKYSVETLKKECGFFLLDNISKDTAYAILCFFDQHSDSVFKENAAKYILKEQLPLTDDHWPEFCDSHPKLAIQLLNRFCQSLPLRPN